MIDAIIDFLALNAAMIGLMFFFIFFSFIGLWTFRPKMKSKYAKHGLIPLEEND